MKFRIYRYDPDKDAKPYIQDYDVTLDHHDRMLLDALIRVKAVDDTLSFTVMLNPNMIQKTGATETALS